MPDWSTYRRVEAPAAAPAPAPATGSRWSQYRAAEPRQIEDPIDPVEPVEPEEAGPGWGSVAAGGGALAGAAGLLGLASKFPGSVGKAAGVANAVRQQLMLSGFAPIKSLLGNVGAAVNQGIAGKGLRPLQQLVSRKTADEFMDTLRNNSDQAMRDSAGSTRGVDLPWFLSMPGRFMGAADKATRGALQRAGATADEAVAETLQTPLGQNFGKFADVLDSPAATYLHPFRRTPFNQFYEGWKIASDASKGDQAARRLLGVHGTLGAAHGAATSDDPLPLSVPMGVAFAGRAGVPYGLAALAARYAVGGKGGGGVASSLLPVSEYGYEQAIGDPLKPYRKPAALSAIERLSGVR